MAMWPFGGSSIEVETQEPWIPPEHERQLCEEASRTGDLFDTPMEIPPQTHSPKVGHKRLYAGAGTGGSGVDSVREDFTRMLEEEREERSDAVREVRAICAALTLSFEGRVQELLRALQMDQVQQGTVPVQLPPPEQPSSEVYQQAEQLVIAIRHSLGDRFREQLATLREEVGRLDSELAKERIVRSDHLTAQLRLIEALPYKDLLQKVESERQERTYEIAELRSELACVRGTSQPGSSGPLSPTGVVGTLGLGVVGTPANVGSTGADLASQLRADLMCRLDALDADLRSSIAARTTEVEVASREVLETQVGALGKEIARELDTRLESLEAVLPERVWAMERALRDMEAEITCLLRDMHRRPVKREEHEAVGIPPIAFREHEAVGTGPRPTPRGHEEQPGRITADTDLKGKITGIISDVQAAFKGLPNQSRPDSLNCYRSPIDNTTPAGSSLVSMVESVPDAFKRASREDLTPFPVGSVGSIGSMAGSIGPLHKTWSVPKLSPAARVRAPSPAQQSAATQARTGTSPCSPPRRPMSPSRSPPRSSWTVEAPGDTGEPHTPLQKRHSASVGNFRDAASPRRTVPPPRVMVQCSSNTQQATTPRMPAPLAQRRGGSPDCGTGRSANVQAMASSRCSSSQARQCIVNTARTRLAVASP
eukprot:CAMPEP_0172827928 /NCGR_PEP_ID=MMETSP1075-20121228/20474_1 /TAXON_ID=2916 /ORGANISM="Ceratium fusus, Strain PA161109" /LENGTH=654 /DNA_ID=CAMNT_0013669843 /DNA_START=27 /DNA_END=1987 /DNA_ORIENTATION=-